MTSFMNSPYSLDPAIQEVFPRRLSLSTHLQQHRYSYQLFWLALPRFSVQIQTWISLEQRFMPTVNSYSWKLLCQRKWLHNCYSSFSIWLKWCSLFLCAIINFNGSQMRWLFGSSTLPHPSLCWNRLEICQKIYTTGFSDQKFYTLKVRNLRQFFTKINSVNALI